MESTEYTTVFKVVQLDEKGRMFSANRNDRDLFLDSKNPTSQVVEYFMGKPAYPKDFLPVLFACENQTVGSLALAFYSRIADTGKTKKCLLLKGRATNVQAFEYGQFAKKHGGKYYVKPPVPSVTCDSFTPDSIVAST